MPAKAGIQYAQSLVYNEHRGYWIARLRNDAQ
jgi:hypothetical protein